jgi:Mce-associated membrane protein
MVKRRSDLATATSPEDGEDSSRDDTSLVGREASDSGSAQLANTDAQEAASSPSPAGRAPRLQRVVVFAALPIVTLGVTAVAGYLKYQAESMRASDAAAVESVRAATDGAIKILSYHADSADKDLAAARDGLTGSFRDDYTKLTRDVVIPGARQKSISTVASVPAAALMSASAEHAQVLVFIDQTVSMGTEPPTSTSSSVKVTLDKQSGRWLISGFDPI